MTVGAKSGQDGKLQRLVRRLRHVLGYRDDAMMVDPDPAALKAWRALLGVKSRK